MIRILFMIEFLDTQSAFEHYKRVLGRNDPIETRAKYNRDRLHVEHYNAHTGQFISKPDNVVSLWLLVC